MITSIPISDIESLLIRQLDNMFGLVEEEKKIVKKAMEGGVKRLERCFDKNPNKYYHRDGETFFNPFQSAQYNIFLYFMSNEIWKSGNSLLADKVYYLNKVLNANDLFYEVELPEYFKCDHPVGSVMGRAQYGTGFSFAQNCTVGNNHGIYPVIGENVRMCAYSSILGDCHIGDNVILGAHASVKDQDIPANSLVFGQSPNLIIKERKK
jgi:serine O-acetyltransferase